MLVLLASCINCCWQQPVLCMLLAVPAVQHAEGGKLLRVEDSSSSYAGSTVHSRLMFWATLCGITSATASKSTSNNLIWHCFMRTRA